MSILFTKAYVANGKTFATLREAQVEGIRELFKDIDHSKPGDTCTDYAMAVVDNLEAVLNILTTTESSRPKARAVNGGKKPRKNRVTDAPAVQTTSA